MSQNDEPIITAIDWTLVTTKWAQDEPQTLQSKVEAAIREDS